MEGRPPRNRQTIRAAAGGLAILLVMTAILGLHLAATANDPHGISGQGPLTAEDVPRLEPLYAAPWTPYRSLDWSPDGRRIALGGDLVPGVTIVDADTGRTVLQIEVPDQVNVVRWSPDGRSLAVGTGSFLSGQGGWVYLYDATGVAERGWRAHSDEVGGLAWSPNGTLLVTTANVRYAIWEAATGALIRRDVNASAFGENVDWSPDGTRIAFGAMGGPSVYDASMGTLLWSSFRGVWDERSVAWSHAGDRIASSNSDGCLDAYSATGQYLWGYNLSYEGGGAASTGTCGAQWSRRPSWSPDDALIAVPTTSGLRVFDSASHVLLRTLAFPVRTGPPPYWLANYGPGDSRDMDAEWAPAGNVLASTGSMSPSSLRLWGIPHRISPWFGVAFNAVLVVGVPVAIGPSFVDLLMRPGAAFERMARPRGRFPGGTALLVFLFLVAGIQQTEWSLEERVVGAEVVPPASWFLGNLVVSLLLAVVPVVLAWLAFERVLFGRRHVDAPPRRPAAELLGWTLLPIVWSYALGLVAVDAVTGVAGSIDPGLATVLVSAAGGFGLFVAVLALSGLPETRPTRALASLAAAAATSVVAGLAMFGLTLLILRMAPGLLTGDFAVYGLAITFGFGLAPWLAALVLLVILGGGFALAMAPPKFLLALFARLRGADISDQRTRRQLLAFLKEHPGTHFRGLLRALPIGSGSLHYHLFVLEREGYVVARRDGMYRRFFPNLFVRREAPAGDRPPQRV